ncbi:MULTISPECIES: hypothetical protein [Roseobacteraceae]|uniref:hypothetical protein n=1 Tax=Roseobacteraceae TaxID=2854170 RepID=UPI00260867F2|nr:MULTISPECIES: hypothetical protein [Roseobacteraceae]
MRHFLQTTAIAATAAIAAFVSTPTPAKAQGYQIDCAILLCLSGGWPASEPCARARAEFIRRITPWPIEPPLQIWRCPMGVAYTVDPDTLTADRIYEILLDLDDAPQQSFPSAPFQDHSRDALVPQPAVVRNSDGAARTLPEGFALQLAQSAETGADIDISDPAFDFVRSIRVYNVTGAHQREAGREGDEECRRSFSMRIGRYGPQGEFSWHGGSDPGQLPAAHTGLSRWGENCPRVWHRSVFVDWRDYEGNYGFEQVNY